MSETKWEMAGSGPEASYTWREFTVKPIKMASGPPHWTGIHNGVEIVRNSDLMAAMTYCEQLARRLGIAQD